MKERMSKKDLNAMIKEADSDNDGFINCHGSDPYKFHLKNILNLAATSYTAIAEQTQKQK